VRLPKQAYFVYRVMQSETPDIHIIGHWTYPINTVKTIYVAANHCDSVELFVNGKSLGETNKPFDFVDSFDNKDYGNTGYIFAFPAIKFEPGKISAVAKANGKIVAQDEIETAGEPKALKLTPHTGQDGLQADGSDVAFFDVEVVDTQGRRCPTDEARVDFKLDGPAIWRGGYNSGKINSINNLWLDTECGLNRVAIRSTLNPGTITLTAARTGLVSATVKIESRPVPRVTNTTTSPFTVPLTAPQMSYGVLGQ
jgi:beta-galactosidase